MLIGNRSKFIDYWSRANTGPICFEDDFDKKIYWPKLKEITKRWEIVYDPKHQVPTDDDMLDRLWQAAIDMVVEVGVLCVDTRRIMHFTRKEIEDMHRTYAIGMLWFLGNDPRVPEYLRKEMKRWGFPKDEFGDTGHFPYQIYVREARRMIGEFVMTEHNIVKDNRTEAGHSVGMGSYALDCHYVSRVIDKDGLLRNEGTIHLPTTPYEISYYSLVPKRNECTNLLVPVCLSASHVAYSSIRMEPNYMVLGQSAATAAAMAIEEGCDIQDVNYENLRERLLKDGQILSNPLLK